MKISSKYELAKIIALELNVINWDTLKNKTNRKINEILFFSNSKIEIKEKIEKIKKEYKFKYNIFPIYSISEYSPEIKKYGIIIE